MKTLNFTDQDMRVTIQFAVESGFKVKRHKKYIKLLKDTHIFKVPTIYSDTYSAGSAVNNINALLKSFQE